MNPNRLSIKFFTSDSVDAPKLIPVFQRWIQQSTVEGLLIDVANYEHVPQGPGILLIAHEWDYSLDLQGGAGIKVTLKRVDGNLDDNLRLAIQLALQAGELLTQEGTLQPITFDYSHAELAILDRLQFPNNEDTFREIESVIRPVLANIYPKFDLRYVTSDSREPLTVLIDNASTITADAIQDKLGIPA